MVNFQSSSTSSMRHHSKASRPILGRTIMWELCAVRLRKSKIAIVGRWAYGGWSDVLLQARLRVAGRDWKPLSRDHRSRAPRPRGQVAPDQCGRVGLSVAGTPIPKDSGVHMGNEAESTVEEP